MQLNPQQFKSRVASAMKGDKASAHLVFEHLLYVPALNATPSLLEQLVLAWYALTGPQMLRGDIESLRDEHDMMLEDMVERGPFESLDEVWPFVYQLWRRGDLVTWVERRGGYETKFVGLRSQMPKGVQLSDSPVDRYKLQEGSLAKSASEHPGTTLLVQGIVLLGVGYGIYRWGKS